MRRDWTKIREVLEDIEADCLDEKLSSLEEKARRLRSLGGLVEAQDDRGRAVAPNHHRAHQGCGGLPREDLIYRERWGGLKLFIGLL